VKIARLKQQADAAEADARDKWLEFRNHSDRSLAIVRRRVGSPAGLAISFSLGFMAGTGRGDRETNGTTAGSGERTAGDDREITYKVAHGPLGDTAIKLGTALLARSLTNFLNERRDDAGLSDSASASSEAPLA
jgi:hypothetical protein